MRQKWSYLLIGFTYNSDSFTPKRDREPKRVRIKKVLEKRNGQMDYKGFVFAFSGRIPKKIFKNNCTLCK